MESIQFPVDAEFVPGQGGTQVLLDPLKNRMCKKKKQVKVVVEGVYQNPVVPPRAIIQEVENRVMAQPSTSAGLACIPKAKSVARMVQRKRKAEWGSEGNLPTTWGEMAIPQQYLQTTSGEDFVILDESLEPPKIGKIWMFASDFTMSILKKSEEW